MTDDSKITLRFDDFGWFSAAPTDRDVNADFLQGLTYEFGLAKTELTDDGTIDYQKAAEFYRKAADKGDGRAQFRLGVLHCLKLGADRDEALAHKLFAEAEKTVKPCILTLIAEIYFLGNGVAKDEQKAEKLWEKADALGCPNAKSFMAKYLGRKFDALETDDPDELAALAESGNIEAQFKLGDIYYDKRGKNNALKAFELLKKAAEEGHAEALYLLSGHLSENDHTNCIPYICSLLDIHSVLFGCAKAARYVAHSYKFGCGVVESKELNVEYIKLSAALGDPEGKHELAKFYGWGESVAKVPFEIDYVKAVELFKEAADASVPDAKYFYNQFMKKLTPEQKNSLSFADRLPQKKLTATELKKLCKQGVEYLRGETVERDLSVAEAYLLKAADQGYAEAQYHLGELYGFICETSDDDEEFEENAELCAEWYEKAAMQGHGEAQFETGKNYMHGEGVEEDKEKAEFWLKKAVENGVEFAAELLKDLKK